MTGRITPCVLPEPAEPSVRIRARVFAAQVECACAIIPPPAVFTPERAEKRHAFAVLSAVAAIFAHRAEVRRSQRTPPDCRAAQAVHALAQPAALPQPIV
jgi:hypothetical protein